jgi:hypothetical protein
MNKNLALLAVLTALAAPAYAGPAGQLMGTWECQAAGAAPSSTPPIVWFGGAASEGKQIDSVVDLDAFGGKASGVSDLLSGSNGWWRVQPQEGAAFLVKPVAGAKDAGAMQLRLGLASYDCRRLPRSA